MKKHHCSNGTSYLPTTTQFIKWNCLNTIASLHGADVLCRARTIYPNH